MPEYPPHIDPRRLPHNIRYDDRGRGRWVYRDRKAGREHRIGGRDATAADLWAAVEALHSGLASTFKTLSKAFQASPTWSDLAPSTKRDYLLCHQAIAMRKTRAGSLLGDVPLSSWTPGAVRRYRDERAKVSKSRAKKDLAYLRRLFAWGVEYEHMQTNPAAAVSTRGLAAAREHYVEDRDYMAALYQAPPKIACMAHLALLTGRRRSDILRVRRTDLTPAGIYFLEGKTGKEVIVGWTTELEQLIEICKEAAGRSFWLFPREGEPGEHYTPSALSSAWGDAQRAIAAQGFNRFQFKDLRAKHATDLEEAGGDATDNLAHADRGLTVRHYIRKPQRVVSLR